VAAALDRASPPALFTDMDGIYDSLDLINIADPAPLQSALVQLDGEAYAAVPTVEIESARMFLGAVHGQMRSAHANPATDETPVHLWLTGFGGGGGIGGGGDAHGISYAMGGIAGGVEHHFDPALLAGVAFGYARSGYATSGISGNGNLNTFSAALYARYAPGNWYVDGVLGYGYGYGTLDRSIMFPGVTRGASGSPSANELLSGVETGYRITLTEHTALTPFVAMQGIAIFQNAAGESGAGAIDLHVRGASTASARGIIGAELTHLVPIGLPEPLLLTLRAGWGHEFANVSRSITASFDGLPGAAFTVHGVPVPRDAALIGIGARLAVRKSVDVFLSYDGSLAGRASTQGGSAGLRLTF
jgi:outer membrane autotransporter protein